MRASVPMSDEQAAVQTLLESAGTRSLIPPLAVTGGWSGTAIWKVELLEGKRLLRVYQPRDVAVAAREAIVMAHAAEAGIPVARVHACNVDGDSPFLLLDWVNGQGLDQEALRRPWRAVALGEQSGLLQARLHRVAAPRGLAHAHTWAPPDAVPDALIDRLQAVEGVERLIHLDFHPANIIVEAGRVSALIDWTNARAGDPRYDVARTYVCLRLLPGITGARRAIAKCVVDAYLRGWRRAYEREMGAPAEMPLFLAWAGFTTLADMRLKPEAAAESEAGRALRRQLEALERKVDDWMGLAGLAARFR